MSTKMDASTAQVHPIFRLGVGGKLTIGLGTLLLAFIATIGIVFGSYASLVSISEQNDDASTALSLSGFLNNFGARQKYLAFDFIITQTDSDRTNYEDARQGFKRTREKMHGIFAKDETPLLKMLDTYCDLHDEWERQIGDKLFRLDATSASFEQGRELLKGSLSADLNSRSRAAGSALGEATQQWASHWLSASKQQLTYLKATIIAGCVAAVVLAGLIGLILTRSISKPLSSLTAVIKRLASGDLQAAIPALGRGDEIGDVLAAMQVFKDAAIEKLRLDHEIGEERRKRSEAEQARIAVAVAEARRQQDLALGALASGLEGLSRGNLTHRLTQNFAQEYEKLRSDFNATADSLQQALRTIANATDGVGSSSLQIAQASDNLSRRTEQQAASLEETSAALNVVSQTVKTMAANAAQAAQVVSTTRGAAETSGAIVAQAVGAMGKIKDSSGQITNIIGVIDEIAFQTNLLALNAGVEAARAGDAGRGFAVVASEVRALAQRSAEAAKEIKSLISASSSQVDSGVELVDKTGLALKEIVAKVAELDALIRRISISSQEQATSIAEINTAVSQMDQVVQQNAAMVEESTAAAHALKGEATDLTAMVGRFEIGGEKAPRRIDASKRRA